MTQKYGKLINSAWDFFDIFFKDGQQISGKKAFTVPTGLKEMPFGNTHAPTPAQLIADGRRLLVPTEYDSSKHKLVVDSYSVIDDTTMGQDTVALTPEEIAEKSLAAASMHIILIDQACREHIDKSAHWTAGPMIWDKAEGNKPKSRAIKEWAEACWLQFYTNEAALKSGGQFSELMLVYPVCPYGIGESFQE